MTDSNFAPTPLHGAAYRTMLERCDLMNCSTAEHHAAITKTVRETLRWAATQDKKVHDAYIWATTQVANTAKSRLAVFENSRSVAAAYQDIPKPPAPEK